MDELAPLVEYSYYSLIGADVCLLVFVSFGRELVGFKRNKRHIWGAKTFVEWMLSVNTFTHAVISTDPFVRGIDLVLALTWGWTGWISYRTWKRHDDDTPDGDRLASKIKSKLPQLRKTATAGA